jgi:hypothetical protein
MLTRARLAWPFDLMDLAFLAGVLLLGIGLWLVWEPLALVVTGIVLMVWAFVAALPPRST